MPISSISKKKLGILGGGQLGRMLIQEALNWNVPVHVLDPDPNCPSAALATSFTKGDFRDYNSVVNFGSSMDYLTIEIEQVNLEALFELEKMGVQVYPQPQVLELIRDKGIQKQFYQNNNLPTSEFILIDQISELNQLDESWFPCFQKSRRDGYDGKGVQALTHRNDIPKAIQEPSLVEKAVDVDIEFAIIASGNGLGQATLFPPVEMEFHPEANLVEFLIVPGNIPKPALVEAIRISEEIIRLTSIRGLLAIEFFLSKSGQVIINEMAPRPHNSGHTTIEGNYCSQFEAHLRAVLGIEQGSTDTIQPAIMINLIGEKGYSGVPVYEGLEEILKVPGVFVHLYGKHETRPFRKMGHITILAPTQEELRSKASLVQGKLKIKA